MPIICSQRRSRFQQRRSNRPTDRKRAARRITPEMQQAMLTILEIISIADGKREIHFLGNSRNIDRRRLLSRSNSLRLYSAPYLKVDAVIGGKHTHCSL